MQVRQFAKRCFSCSLFFRQQQQANVAAADLTQFLARVNETILQDTQLLQHVKQMGITRILIIYKIVDSQNDLINKWYATNERLLAAYLQHIQGESTTLNRETMDLVIAKRDDIGLASQDTYELQSQVLAVTENAIEQAFTVALPEPNVFFGNDALIEHIYVSTFEVLATSYQDKLASAAQNVQEQDKKRLIRPIMVQAQQQVLARYASDFSVPMLLLFLSYRAALEEWLHRHANHNLKMIEFATRQHQVLEGMFQPTRAQRNAQSKKIIFASMAFSVVTLVAFGLYLVAQ